MKSSKEKELSRQVRRCARPIEHRNGNERAVLCIHGFTGYPGEMAYPAKRLAESGWDVYVPRLSGHGTDGDDFKKVGMEDWRRQIADDWLDLTAAYKDVAVLGHSMGGLLTLDLASQYPVTKVGLLAPAVGLRYKGWRLLKLISKINPKRPYAWKPDPSYTFFDDRDPDDDAYLGAEYWSWIWLRHLWELLDLQFNVEKRLGSIRCPVMGVFAGQDNVLGSFGIEVLKKGLPKQSFESVLLEDCGHYIPYDPNPGQKEAAMDTVIRWFDK